MRRNEEFPVGSRVRWVRGGRLLEGVVALQSCFRTSVRLDGAAAVLPFDPRGTDLIPGDAPPLTFRYTNYRGESELRRAIPLGAPWYGTTEHHPVATWLLPAWCLDRQAERDFDVQAMRGETP
jgi:hypothetical protein